MRRCPTCGASYTTDAHVCEADGAALIDDESPVASSRPPSKGARCPLCAEGLVEADGFCSACGRRALSSRPTPPLVPVGAPLAGGVVVSSPGGDEYLVRAAGGATMRVVLGDAAAIEREADLMERIGGSGPFPGVAECGVDDTHGSYLAVAAPPADARPLSEVGSSLTLATAIGVVRALIDAAQVIEKIGFAWEPQRDDVHVRPDGSIKISRVRVPRKLGQGERLDARAVVEAVGPTFVPTPALEGPSRAFRLLLPHVPIPGDAGNSISEVRREIAAVELDLAPPTDDGLRIAGLCDPGLRRPHNEDALAFATGTTDGERWSALVVCDGVSSSSHADRASAIAAKTACDSLAQAARAGEVSLEAGKAAVALAIHAAHAAVCNQPVEVDGEDPPGTTIVVALVWQQRLTVGWVGDSRAYWVSDDAADQLTHDHSWAVEAVTRGEVTESEAAMSPLSHALTRCLGPLEAADGDEPLVAGERPRFAEVQPGIRARDLKGPGWVILCSDGFWNYFSKPADVATLVRIGASFASPARVARRLVNHASCPRRSGQRDRPRLPAPLRRRAYALASTGSSLYFCRTRDRYSIAIVARPRSSSQPMTGMTSGIASNGITTYSAAATTNALPARDASGSRKKRKKAWAHGRGRRNRRMRRTLRPVPRKGSPSRWRTACRASPVSLPRGSLPSAPFLRRADLSRKNPLSRPARFRISARGLL